MRRWLAVLAFTCAGAAGAAQEYLSLTRSDGAAVPILEFGANAPDCRPLLVLSHGFGGTESGLSFLAEAMSKNGFRAIAIGHRESGRAQLRTVLRSGNKQAALNAAVQDRRANTARMQDLDAVWSYATKDCRPPFAALAGHSMGAQLAIIEAGAETTIGIAGKDRFDAYVALSPQGVGARFSPGAWRGIEKPVLMITGTRDAGLDGDWTQRVTAFDGLPEGDKWLAVLEGGTHRDLGGRGRLRHQRNVTSIVLAFLKHMGKPSRKDMPNRKGVRYREK